MAGSEVPVNVLISLLKSFCFLYLKSFFGFENHGLLWSGLDKKTDFIDFGLKLRSIELVPIFLLKLEPQIEPTMHSALFMA